MILYLFLTMVLGIVCAWGLIVAVPIVFNSERLANLYLLAAMKIGKRTSLVVTRSGELKWRRMKDTKTGSQEISMNGNTTTLSDPDRSILPLYGKPFAIADSVYGLIYTPIHAALGGSKARLEAENNYTIEANKDQKKAEGIHGWIQDRLFVPMSKCPDLRDVRALATGRERGTDPSKAREFYKFIKMNKQSGLTILKALVPIGVYVVLTVLQWQLFGSSSGAETAANATNPENETTISILLFSISSIPHRKKIATFVLLCGAVTIGAYFVPIYTVLAILFSVMWIVGVAIGLGMFGLLGLMLGGAGFGGVTSGLLFSSALWIIDSPTIVQDTREYYMIDKQLDGPTFKYRRHGIQFAFTEEAIKHFDGYLCDTGEYDMPDDIEKTEKGERGRVRTVEGLAQSPSEPGYYVSMAAALSNLASGFVGRETDTKVQEAKEEFGDGVTGMSVRTVTYASMGSIVLSIITGVVFF